MTESCECGNKSIGSIQSCEFIDQLSASYRLKKDLVQWIYKPIVQIVRAGPRHHLEGDFETCTAQTFY
jgi:hypothetical protein